MEFLFQFWVVEKLYKINKAQLCRYIIDQETYRNLGKRVNVGTKLGKRSSCFKIGSFEKVLQRNNYRLTNHFKIQWLKTINRYYFVHESLIQTGYFAGLVCTQLILTKLIHVLTLTSWVGLAALQNMASLFYLEIFRLLTGVTEMAEPCIYHL